MKKRDSKDSTAEKSDNVESDCGKQQPQTAVEELECLNPKPTSVFVTNGK